jgi:hypothetical protein
MVRIITCWCLARYTQWVLLPPGGEPQQHPGQQQPPQIAPENEVGLVGGAWWCVVNRTAR